MRIRLAVALVALCACRGGSLADSAIGLRLAPEALEFPTTPAGGESTRAVTLINTGRVDVDLAVVAAPPFFAARSAHVSATAELSVTFRPLGAGVFRGVLRIGDHEVPLTAQAMDPPVCAAPSACHAARVDPDTFTCTEAAQPDGTACTDPCLVGSACHGGACLGLPKSCDDGDACTVDACGAEGCASAPVACPPALGPCQAARCDSRTGCAVEELPDGTACGVADCATAHVCFAGTCQLRATPNTCDDVTAGLQHACDLRNGKVRCWGDNHSGQLARDTSLVQQSATALPITGLPADVHAISASAWSTCALASGFVWCWGGLAPSAAWPLPSRPVAGVEHAVAIVSGDRHHCAIVAGGAVWCWGFAVLGDGDTTFSSRSSDVAVPVFGLSEGVTALAATDSHTCAAQHGKVVCWGDADGLPQVYTPIPLLEFLDHHPASPDPVAVELQGPVDRLATGWNQVCVLRAGVPRCFERGGWSAQLQLPVVQGVATLASNAARSCAWGTAGLTCWSSGTSVETVPTPAGATAISVGRSQFCATGSAGTHCWQFGQTPALIQ